MGYTDPPPTAVAGQTLKAVDWNLKVRDNISAAAKPPRARVRRTTNQSIPNNASTVLSFDTADYVSDNIWLVGSPTRLVAPVTGIYSVKGGAQFAVNLTGARLLFITKGVTTIATNHSVGNASWYVGGTVESEINLTAGEYVELLAYQASGAALNIDVAYPVWFAMSLISYG
ncbi:MAG: hypothetical protein ACR2M4_02950 [Actinomycetota bacterium]